MGRQTLLCAALHQAPGDSSKLRALPEYLYLINNLDL
jgi:hypothetical protein